MPEITEEQARNHFQTVVEPCAQEFLSNVGSIRHGYQAAIMLAHMAEYYYLAGMSGSNAGNSSKYYEELARTDPDFELLADVCNASKHAVLQSSIGKGSAQRQRSLQGSESIRSGPLLANSSRPANSALPANENVIHVIFDRGPKSGTYQELDLAVEKVLSDWRRKLGLQP